MRQLFSMKLGLFLVLGLLVALLVGLMIWRFIVAGD